MLTTIAAAGLLQRAADRRGRVAVLRSLGFQSPAGTLARDVARTLGLEDAVRRADIAEGPGTLRAVLLEIDASPSMRDAVGRAAHRVALRAPELLWLVLAHSRSGEITLAIPSPGGARRVAALVVDPAHVRASDAESLAALVGACGAHDLDTHLRWRETLGRDALTRRFYRDLERAVHALGEHAHGSARPDVRRALALRVVSRLLFLAFLEAKGWLDGDRTFLSRHVAACGANLHSALLDPLFFGTLNTPLTHRAPAARAFGRVPFLNGGLFTRDVLEKTHRRLRFADDDIAHVVGDVLGRYRVTAHEDSEDFAEAAVDPEMLGRAFESLMALDERHNTGAFYTPPGMIRHITDAALEASLGTLGLRAALEEARSGRVADHHDATRLCDALSALRLLDPACGTGAFLVHAMTDVSRLLAAAGDDRVEHVRRRAILAHSIFGVDINPTAVWLCELRLWLSVVVDNPERDPMAVPPLPNLDRHIRCADALHGPAFDVGGGHDAGVTRLRERYARASGRRKHALQRTLDRAERTLAMNALQERLRVAAVRRRDLLGAVRGRDLFGGRRVATATERAALETFRTESRALRRALAALRAGGAVPFGFASHFGDVATRGGFDVVLGNPPWVRLHRIPPTDRERLRAQYASMRNAAWRAGAAASGAMTGFGMQADLAALFSERSLALVRPDGVVALLLPAKLFRSLAGGGLRAVLARDAAVLVCEDHTAGRALFDAAVYPAVLVAQRNGSCAPGADTQCAVVRRDITVQWRLPRSHLPLEASEGAPWLLLPPPVRAAFAALAAHATPLAASCFGRPLLGVKSGCNEAFVVHPARGWQARSGAAICEVTSGERRGAITRDALRPVLRGEDLAPYAAAATDAAIIWTHDHTLQPMRTLPPRTSRWLSHWRPTLERRADARTRDRWWSLFRLESVTPSWRVVWGDVGRTPRALVLGPDDPHIPLNSCYVVRAPSVEDADALAVWLNSPLALAWLSAIAEPARGGYHRFLGWTMARLPPPADWSRARRLLSPLGRAARDGTLPAPSAVHAASLRAFGVGAATVEPLLTWMHC